MNKKITIFALIIGVFIAALIIVNYIVSCFCSSNIATNSFTNKYTNGNILNVGMAVEDDNYLYFTNVEDNSYIYRKNIKSGEVEQLTKGYYSYNLNLVGDYIYYIRGIPGIIQRVNLNTLKEKTIVHNRSENLIVYNNNMYYRLSEDNDWGKLYKADLNGKHKTIIAYDVVNFVIENNYIYYLSNNDGLIYRIDINGNGKIVLTDKKAYSIGGVLNGTVYFLDDDTNNIYSVDEKNKKCKLVLSQDCRSLNVNDGYIYYINAIKSKNFQNEYKVYRVKTDGSQNELVVNKNKCSHINITKNYLIFYDENADFKCYYLDKNENTLNELS